MILNVEKFISSLDIIIGMKNNVFICLIQCLIPWK